MSEHEHTEEHDDDAVHVHVHSWKFYAAILGALLFLTIVTVTTSYLDLDRFFALGEEIHGVGAWNLGLALMIATMKASLVVLFFMHLKDDARFNALVFVGSLLFIGVFFAYTMNDTALRGTMDRYNGVRVDPDTGLAAPGSLPPGDGIFGETPPPGRTDIEPPAAEEEHSSGEHAAEPAAEVAEPAPVEAAPAEAPAEAAPVEAPAEAPAEAEPPAEEPPAAAEPPPAEEPAAESLPPRPRAAARVRRPRKRPRVRGARVRRPSRSPKTIRDRIALALASSLLISCSQCEGTRREVASLPDLPYPTCDGAELPEGEVIASEVLRSGPTMPDQDVVERFEIRRRGCVTVVRVQQEWPLGTADLDVVYDDHMLPLRVWRRTTMPGADHLIDELDVARYELRTPAVGMTHRGPSGPVERAELIGHHPRAIIGPGRGILTMWFQRAHLRQGGRLREWVLDVREPIAELREVTLQRETDQSFEGVGRVRVYTIYGSEPVFASEDDVVTGDLMGMRQASRVRGPIPDPLPDPGPIDPTSGYE